MHVDLFLYWACHCGVRQGKHVGMVLVGKGRGRRHQSWEDEKEETEEGSYWQAEG